MSCTKTIYLLIDFFSMLSQPGAPHLLQHLWAGVFRGFYISDSLAWLFWGTHSPSPPTSLIVGGQARQEMCSGHHLEGRKTQRCQLRIDAATFKCPAFEMSINIGCGERKRRRVPHVGHFCRGCHFFPAEIAYVLRHHGGTKRVRGEVKVCWRGC